jgi:hypothetical protein
MYIKKVEGVEESLIQKKQSEEEKLRCRAGKLPGNLKH